MTFRQTIRNPVQACGPLASHADVFPHLAVPLGQLACGPLAAHYGPTAVATIAALAQTAPALLPLLARSVRTLPHGAAAA
ncbi:hypothetical protein [Kitasatospora sp. NPDC004531]